MNGFLLILCLATLLLGGCGKPADRPGDAQAVETTADRASEVKVSSPPTPAPAADAATTAASGTDVAPAPDDGSAVNASIDKLLGDHARYQEVILAYRQAVAHGDKAAVAALVEYPIKVEMDGSKTTIEDSQAFVRDYDKIVTPAIARAIEGQKYSELMVNSKGVMFGSGQTWINGVCKQGSADCNELEVRVVAIQPGVPD